MPSTRATAAPELDPPAERDGSKGLRTTPNAVSSVVVPNANSCRLVLPMMMAPASRSRRTTGASSVGTERRHRRTGGRRRAGDVDQVFDRDRDAVQRPPAASGGNLSGRCVGLGQRRLRHDRDEDVRCPAGFDPGEAAADEVHRGNLAAGDQRRDRRDAAQVGRGGGHDCPRGSRSSRIAWSARRKPAVARASPSRSGLSSGSPRCRRPRPRPRASPRSVIRS